MSNYPLPKIDLHLHLDGSVLPETAWELAKEAGVASGLRILRVRQFIVVTADCRSVNEYLKRFELPLQILQDAASLARVTRELIGLLARQGLAYAEIRFAPQLHLRGALTQRDAIEAVLEGRRQGLAENPGIGVGIILCTMCVGPETVNMDLNLETVRLAKEYLGSGVVAVDLAGAEGIVPLKTLPRSLISPGSSKFLSPAMPETVRGRTRCGMRWISAPSESVTVTIIFDDKALCRRAIDEGVTLEICPTSNVQCRSQPGYAEHPAKKLFDMGMKITINTDNMILSGIDLDTEYDHCLQEMGFSRADLLQMLAYSAEAAFLPQSEKAELLARIRACR